MRSWGRGGAGNINYEEQMKQRSDKQAKEDLEANRSSDTSTERPPMASRPSQAQDYAHMGRGGAGNWYEPSKLEKEGTFAQPSDSTAAPPSSSKPQVSTPWHPERQEMPVGRAGRGGAGNFVWKDEEKEKRIAEEQEKKKGEVGERVEKDVEVGLAKPGAAVLGGVKAGRGW